MPRVVFTSNQVLGKGLPQQHAYDLVTQLPPIYCVRFAD